MINNIEYTYEFLRKCHGLRFKAVWNGNGMEGIIKVEKDGVVLCYGEETLENFDYFRRVCGKRLTRTFGFSEHGITDFEIVPRDPDTYKDWQVGDVLEKSGKRYVIIFRCGEVTAYKEEDDNCASQIYTCNEIFYKGNFRLVLTDVEKRPITERQWEPQDGDVCYLESNHKWVFIKRGDKDRTDAYARFDLGSGSCSLYGKVLCALPVYKLRPASDFEKELLSYALAKKGKRWNAEKKCIEDIPKPHEFKKFDPVLVRDSIYNEWTPNVFLRKKDCYYRTVDNKYWIECIPLDEDAESLIGTSNLCAKEKVV